MKPFKMWANTNEEALSILNYMFAKGYSWLGGSTALSENDHTKGGYYVDADGVMGYSTRNDREYYDDQEYEEFNFAVAPATTPVELTEEAVQGVVVSDGLSTSYYQLTITNKAGEIINCEMGDVIRCVFGDNFSLGNIVKAARRMHEASQGRGKKDVSMRYDANKIAYFSSEYADFYENTKNA